jgi:hypothetical protein
MPVARLKGPPRAVSGYLFHRTQTLAVPLCRDDCQPISGSSGQSAC